VCSLISLPFIYLSTMMNGWSTTRFTVMINIALGQCYYLFSWCFSYSQSK
jgi:hypothetical protein